MDLQLAGKTVLVTGSSRGLGCSIAKAFYAQGCYVILNGRHEIPLKQLANTLGERASYILADVTKVDDCQALAKKIKSLDILICNVGSGASVRPGEETHDEWRRVFDLNLHSATNSIEALKGHLFQSQGSVVCISSIAGCSYLSGAPATYSAAKSALNMYVKGVSRTFAQKNVRINAVAPGNLLFDGSVWEKKLKEDKPAVTNMLKDKVDMARLGTPEEIANFVLFLASNKASFSTGAVHIVDGGQIK